MRVILRLEARPKTRPRKLHGIPRYAAPELLVGWSSRWAEFPENLAVLLTPAVVTGFRPVEEAGGVSAPGLWAPVRGGGMAPSAFAASLAAHLFFLGLLLAAPMLFGRRPVTSGQLAALREQRITWYHLSNELPAISPDDPEAPNPLTQPSASERRWRQRIISVRPNADNSSQTILQPDVPEVRLAQHVPLPNIVRWPSEPRRPALEYLPAPDVVVGRVAQLSLPEPPRPSLAYLPPADVRISSAPVLPAAPAERPSLEYLPPPAPLATQAPHLPMPAAAPPSLEYLPAPDVRLKQAARLPAGEIPRPELAYLRPPEVRLEQRPRAALPASPPAPVVQAFLAAPPQVATANTANRILVVGLDPAPPAPLLAVPEGNRAGRFSTVREDGKPAPEEGVLNATAAASSLQPPASSLRVPAISVDAGINPPSPDAGPIVSGPQPPAPANLLAHATRPPIGWPEITRGRQPADEGPLTGKKIYTTYINMPNLSSQLGSWVLRFAELGERTAGSPAAELTAPVARRKVDPGYDPDAVREGIQGVVVLYAVIHQDGRVDSIKVLRSLDPRLDRHAITALGRWEFEPARRNGAPVDLEALVQIPFLLAANPGKH
jgi:TonB family protein